MPKKLTTEEFVERAKAVHGKRYDYAKTVYSGVSGKCVIICKQHGAFLQTAKKHLYGQGCSKCGHLQGGAKRRMSTAHYIKRAKVVHGSFFGYEKTKYTDPFTKVTITCPKHGDFAQLMHNHIDGQGCPSCKHEKFGKSRKKPFIEFVQEANKLHGNKFEYSKKNYDSAYVTVICKKHGAFKQLKNNHLKGKGCLACKHENRRSKIEVAVAKWLSRFAKVQTSTRIEGKEIDIYLPKYKLGIEINGLYWHSEKLAGKTKHKNKRDLAESHGIKLLTLWEHELKQKVSIIKSMLLVQLFRAKRIFARNTIVREITATESKDFLNEHHLHGARAASVHLGCFFNDELAGVMTFGHSRFDKQFEWEIIRLGWKKRIVVTGGASKLFSAFKSLYSPNSVISYADLDSGDGNVYTNLGFIFSHVALPNYFWVRNTQVLSRYQTQKHKLRKLLGTSFDSNLSERENMQNAGFYRVFNSGNAVYIWKNPNA